ncbi:hypothetical protein [Klebsiella pneumoniae]|uniref:hypothetical protein n=1 Tax=Klebsiella pneumoniae TaxID=573 RepID=UPI000B2ADA17|nr:hypothetical protein [Klebsiella pneumoniae]HBS6127878.1 hypothetical protein [Klebsiella pneumoniae]HBS6472985.1 hypothetical protein [Klebsiella pneumoniae]HBS6646992.1 hypothetical protein [Klebsiella pneumoniae]HBS6662430.1 hypothetical protein [Klebsiella pneumoniae]HBS6682530.1 hypothetical protein [Klebsiella pneumoniae]
MERELRDAFDIWYQELCGYLLKKGKCAPYKMAWLEFYEAGQSVVEAAAIGPSENT